MASILFCSLLFLVDVTLASDGLVLSPKGVNYEGDATTKINVSNNEKSFFWLLTGFCFWSHVKISCGVDGGEERDGRWVPGNGRLGYKLRWSLHLEYGRLLCWRLCHFPVSRSNSCLVLQLQYSLYSVSAFFFLWSFCLSCVGYYLFLLLAVKWEASVYQGPYHRVLGIWVTWEQCKLLSLYFHFLLHLIATAVDFWLWIFLCLIIIWIDSGFMDIVSLFKFCLLDVKEVIGALILSVASSFVLFTCRLLQNNQLTGPIPAEIGKLLALQTLDLSGNQFAGDIPSSLGFLTHLSSLWVWLHLCNWHWHSFWFQHWVFFWTILFNHLTCQFFLGGSVGTSYLDRFLNL